MKTLIGASLGLLALTAPALGLADPEPPPTWGRAYLSFSPDEPDRSRYVDPFEPVTFYLVLELEFPGAEQGGVGAVEGLLVYSPSLFLSAIDWGGQHLDAGYGLQEGSYDFVIGFLENEATLLVDGPNVIAEFTGVLLEEDEVFIGIEGRPRCGKPEPIDCTPLRWIYSKRLNHGDLYRAEVDAHRGGILLNKEWSGLAALPSSWSRLKALYDR